MTYQRLLTPEDVVSAEGVLAMVLVLLVSSASESATSSAATMRIKMSEDDYISKNLPVGSETRTEPATSSGTATIIKMSVKLRMIVSNKNLPGESGA